MAVYWCRFLDRDGRVYAAEKLVCANVDAAIAKARDILVDGEGCGFEIWEHSTRIHLEQPSSARAD